MTEHLLSFLIVCPLVFLAGFVDAIAGGGGLISLPAYLITGLPVHNAIATNKTSSAMRTQVVDAVVVRLTASTFGILTQRDVVRLVAQGDRKSVV